MRPRRRPTRCPDRPRLPPTDRSAATLRSWPQQVRTPRIAALQHPSRVKDPLDPDRLFTAGKTQSERLVARADQERTDLSLVDTPSHELPVEAERRQGPAAPRAELEILVAGRLAPRAAGDLDLTIGLQPGIAESVDVALAVVPLDVLVLVDLERGLVHPGLTGPQHVLEVLPKEVPFVEMVLAAIGAGDHHALDSLGAEHLSHPVQVAQVRADIVRLVGIKAGRGLVPRVDRVLHHPSFSSSSSFRENARNPSAYSIPPFSPSSFARSRTHCRSSSTPWDRCFVRASIFRSIVLVMSTYVSGSSVDNQRFGTSYGSNPPSRSSGNWGREGASGMMAHSASSPAARGWAGLMCRRADDGRGGSGATIAWGRSRRTARVTALRVSRFTSSIPSGKSRNVTVRTPRTRAASSCSGFRIPEISSLVLPGSFEPAEPSVTIT